MDYKLAASYWTKKDETAPRAGEEFVKAERERFIRSHKTCALATAYGDFVRCTPIEYNYYKGCFYLLSEGGLKFYALEHNKNACLSIFDEYTGFKHINGMQITARAEIIEPWSKEYMEILRFKKISEAAMRKYSHPMYLIKLIPTQIDFMSSAFKEAGFSYRQKIVF